MKRMPFPGGAGRVESRDSVDKLGESCTIGLTLGRKGVLCPLSGLGWARDVLILARSIGVDFCTP
jgi:hypothetical protein